MDLAGPGQLTPLLGVWRALLQILAGRPEEGLRQWTAATARLGEMGDANAEPMAFAGQVVAAWHGGTLAELAGPLVTVAQARGSFAGVVRRLTTIP